MKLGWKLLAIVAVIVLAGSYILYAWNYQGNYNVTTQLNLNVDDNGNVAIAGFEYDCEEVGYDDFWGSFRGHTIDEGFTGYMIYYELNQSGAKSTLIGNEVIENGASAVVLQHMDNLAPGVASVKISIMDVHNTLLTEHTYPLVIGP